MWILISGGRKNEDLMIEVKLVLYELAQSYLAIYEQKLLIDFLCLVEVS